MLPSEVTNLKIKDAMQFDSQGNAMKVRIYTFFIGNHGPFTETFLAGEQDTPSVERRINTLVSQLREQGALTQQTTT